MKSGTVMGYSTLLLREDVGKGGWYGSRDTASTINTSVITHDAEVEVNT